MDTQTLDEIALLQIWPFGHGVLVTGQGVTEGRGVLIIRAVPDGHTLAAGGNGVDAWNAAGETRGPQCCLTFNSPEAAKKLAGGLMILADTLRDHLLKGEGR